MSCGQRVSRSLSPLAIVPRLTKRFRVEIRTSEGAFIPDIERALAPHGAGKQGRMLTERSAHLDPSPSRHYLES